MKEFQYMAEQGQHKCQRHDLSAVDVPRDLIPLLLQGTLLETYLHHHFQNPWNRKMLEPDITRVNQTRIIHPKIKLSNSLQVLLNQFQNQLFYLVILKSHCRCRAKIVHWWRKMLSLLKISLPLIMVDTVQNLRQK